MRGAGYEAFGIPPGAPIGGCDPPQPAKTPSAAEAAKTLKVERRAFMAVSGEARG